MTKKFLSVLSVLLALGAPSLAHAALQDSIVAIVNDDIISVSDVKARMKLAGLSANIPDTPETQAKMFPQVVRSLIDETLQMQEGKKYNLTVSKEEIEQAESRLAADNKLPGNLETFLQQHGISARTMQDQIRATLTWHKVLGTQVRPRIDIGDDEIDAVIERMRANAGKQEYLISEVFLAVDKPEDEGEVKALADKLVQQMQSGTPFGAIARQFSQGLGATEGGDLGWIQSGQLSTQLDAVLIKMKAGSIAGPIRAADGYHIIGVRDVRTIAVGDVKEMTVKMQQLFRPFTTDTEKTQLLNEANNIRTNLTSCDGLAERVATEYPAWRHQDLGAVKLESAPAWLAQKIANVPNGQASEPMATKEGALVVFVCDRSAPENFDRGAILSSIGTEKLEMMARRLLRDLRKSAYLDLRAKSLP